MRRSLQLVLLIVIGVASGQTNKFKTRIVGGQNALPHEFPHQISLQWRFDDTDSYMHICGGSVIGPHWILTAAHCKVQLSQQESYQAMAGVHNLAELDNAVQVRSVTLFLLHEGYTVPPGSPGPNDIGLIKVTEAFKFNEFVKPIALKVLDWISDQDAMLSGWGSTSNTTQQFYPNILQKVELPLISLELCRYLYPNQILRNTHICTGPLDGSRSSCFGDSGGPLIQYTDSNPVQIGIVSWGRFPCASINASAVYTKVSAYRIWIKWTIFKTDKLSFLTSN